MDGEIGLVANEGIDKDTLRENGREFGDGATLHNEEAIFSSLYHIYKS